MTRIAPGLRDFVVNPTSCGWHPHPDSTVAGPLQLRASRELRALLGVVRAARRLAEARGAGRSYYHWADIDLIRALSRLDRFNEEAR